MPAHTAGRIGGSVFGSKKTALSAATHDHRSNNIVVHQHYNNSMQPLTLLPSTTFITHTPFTTSYAVTPFVVSDGAFVTFLIAFHIVGFILWSHHNKH